MRAYSHQGHGPRADQTGRIHISDFRNPRTISLANGSRSIHKGHFQTSGRVAARSVRPSTTDMSRPHRHVGFVPISEAAASFDHLIGDREARGRYRKAKASGGLEVDDKLVLGWSLYWKIARLFTPEGAIDMTSRAPRRNARSDYAAPIGQLYIPWTFADHHLF
jgi:hypothetical protein